MGDRDSALSTRTWPRYALGDLHFALAGEQRDRAHLAQVHAHGVVGFFQGAGGEVEFDVLPFFDFFEFLVERGRRQFGAFQHVDSLRTDGGEQIVQVFGTVHILRDQVVDLIVSEISLLFACIDQLFYVAVLIF